MFPLSYLIMAEEKDETINNLSDRVCTRSDNDDEPKQEDFDDDEDMLKEVIVVDEDGD